VKQKKTRVLHIAESRLQEPSGQIIF
jgi:hypothetical protein